MAKKKKKTRSPATEAEIAQIRSMRSNGATLRQIADTIGRSVTLVRDHCGDIESRDTRRSHAYDAGTIATARRMRQEGATLDEISAKLGPSAPTVTRWCRDIAKPKAAKQTKQDLQAFDRKERRTRAADMKAGTPRGNQYEPPVGSGPSWMPTTSEGYDTDGLFPDDRLVAHSSAVIQGHLEDKARGVVFPTIPTPTLQAMLISATTFRVWDPVWFRENREHWRAVRQFCDVGILEIAERTDVSASSISRYEKLVRTPHTGHLEQLRMAYAAILEERLYRLDLWLCLTDYATAHELDTEDEYDLDDALRWIAGIGDAQEGDEAWDEYVTLDHLPSLRVARSLQPIPEYRDEDTMLFGYAGFATSAEEGERDGAA